MPQCPLHCIVLFPKFRGARITRINTYLPGRYTSHAWHRARLVDGGKGPIIGDSLRSEMQNPNWFRRRMWVGGEEIRYSVKFQGDSCRNGWSWGHEKGRLDCYCCHCHPRLCFFTASASLSASISLDCSPGSSRLTPYSLSSG